jgi:hypothetical protein
MLTSRFPGFLRRNLIVGIASLLACTAATAQTAISTLAGSSPAIAAGNVDATGTAARFSAPASVAVDAAGNIYVADASNHKIRKVTAAGVVTTLAGSGSQGNANGVGGAATFNFPQGVATDGTNVYVADTFNHVIRKVVIADGTVTTLAGTMSSSGTSTGVVGAGKLNNPLGVAVSGTDLYVADTSNHAIRRVAIATGEIFNFVGTPGTSGSTDGTGAVALFKNPGAIAAEGTTNLYVADTANHTIRKIVIAGGGVVTTHAGTAGGVGGAVDSTGASASFKSPGGVVVSGTNLFVADTGNNTIRTVGLVTQIVNTVAGSAGSVGTTDAIGTSARFQGPTGIGANAAGTIYIADTNNHTIRSGGAAVAPTVSNPANASVAVGANPTFTVTVTGNPTPTIQWERQAANTVGFVTISNGATYSGVGTATLTVANVSLAMSNDQFRATVTNGVGGAVSSTTPAVLTVQQAPTITSAATTSFSVNTAGTFTATATGSPAPTFSVTAGTFPPWASLNATTGVISGTPTNNTGSPFSFTLQASNAVAPAATQAFTLTVQNGAAIATAPVNATVSPGGTASFSVVASGTPSTFTYQWYRNAGGVSGFSPMTDIGGTYWGTATSNLTIFSAQQIWSGDQFQVVVSNGIGSPVTSSTATLTVVVAPAITSAASTLFALNTANSFTILSTGSPAPTFSVTSGTFPPWASLNATTGVISGTPTNNTGSPFSFTLQASNAVAPAATQSFTLSVLETPSLINLSILRDVPPEGMTAYFRIEGTGPKQVLIRGAGPSLGALGVGGTMPDPVLELVNSTGAVIAVNDNWGGASSITAVMSDVGAFPFTGPTSRDAALVATLAPGFYAARLSGVGGSTGLAIFEIYEADRSSRTSVFTYLAVRSSANYTVGFVVSGYTPSSIVVRAVGPSLKEVGSLNDPVLDLFSSSSTRITANDNWGGNATVAAVAANFGAIPFVAATGRDSALSATLAPGSYSAQVSGVGGASGVVLAEIFDASVSTTSRSPFLYSPPTAQSVLAGQTATFSVTAGGSGTLGYQWRRNGAPISGATSVTYSFTAMGSDSGNYDVVISNAAGSLTSVAASLTVTVPAPPTITSATGAGTIGAGFNTVFSVSATGTAPLTYQWRKDGVPLSAATNSTLQLNAVTVPDSGVYDVVVSNPGGSVNSIQLPLTVTPPVAPAITAQPLGGTLNIGNLASFRVTATGSPTLTYQWRKNGSPIAGATSNVYILGAATAVSAGTFDVIVTNMAGAVTSTAAELTINPPVVFNAQPTSVTTFVGIAVTFSAPATGFPGTPTYQWRKDGIVISGATISTFTFASVQLADAGTYDVVATTAAGSATSNAATLTISDSAPQITSQPVGTALAVGGNTTLSVTVVGSVPLTYQWRRDGIALLGATTASFPVVNAQTYHAGDYTVVVTNALGSVTSAAARLNVVPRVVAYSARLQIDADGAVAVFTVEGTLPKKVLLRAVGPGLAPFGFSGLPDPQLELFSSTGTLLAINNDWATSADTAAISTTTAAVGAFALAIGSRDSAMIATLAPGTYTVRAKPASGAGGTGYLELYDADLATAPMSTLPYVAVRGRMGAGGGVVIGGLGSNGRGQRSYLVRAIGPSLGLPGAHANPAMLIVRDGTLVGSNDDWDTNPGDTTATAAAVTRVATFALAAGARDSALVLTGNLHAGACTVQVGGSDALGGTVLLELHDLDAARPATFAPAIVSSPVSTTAITGEPVTLRVLAQGTAPLGYQWRKDGIPLDGATTATLTFASAQPAQGGSYTVHVSNSLGAATSLNATLAVQSSSSGSAATQAVVGSGYAAGGTATITNTLVYTTLATGLGWKVTLPVGWKFVSDSGALGDVRPVAGTVGTLDWAWSTPPVGPVTFTYTVSVPPGTAGDQFIAASGIVRFDGSVSQPIATPSPLRVPQITTHSADTDADFRIGLFELTRVIELYNTRLGTTRTGRYRIQDGSEDGFGLDATLSGGAAVTLIRFHSADSDRSATIGLVELTRVIELFNTRAGTARTGAYHVATTPSEDGFAPGP